MRFASNAIHGLLSNEQDVVGHALRSIERSDQIVIAQGYGVRADDVPLRFLAYCIPVLHLLHALPPGATGEVYVALHGAERANGLDLIRSRQVAAEMAHLLRWYAQTIHGMTAPRFACLEDVALARQGELDAFIEQLLSDELLERFRSHPKLWHFIEQRGGRPALRYMAEHALYMRDPLACNQEPVYTLVPGMRFNMQHVVMVGGPAERVFFDGRKVLLDVFGQHHRWTSHQFFTKVGDPPTYHRQPGEPLWRDRAHLPEDVELLLQLAHRETEDSGGARSGVVHDLCVLLADLGGCTSFASVVQERRNISRGQPLTKDTLAILQRGWSRLRSF